MCLRRCKLLHSGTNRTTTTNVLLEVFSLSATSTQHFVMSSMSNTARDDRHSSKIVVHGPKHAGSTGQCSVPSTPTNATSLLRDSQVNSQRLSVGAKSSTDAQTNTKDSNQTTNKGWRRRLLPKWRTSSSNDIEKGRRQSRPALPREMDQDELFLAMTGYNQVFDRILRPMDNFFAMLSTMGLTTAMPAILSLVSIFVGGPKAALVNWIVVGFFSVLLTLCLGEIAASMPTSAGGSHVHFSNNVLNESRSVLL